MPENSDNAPDGRDPSSPDPFELGMAAAFGGAGEKAASPSVLQILQERSGSVIGVQLESPGPGDAPVKVTEEARRLRDPSGRYQVLGEIGRGGVGVVYKGRDQDLGRDVAMKILKDEYAERPDVLARFVEEAQIGGQLQHPGIVPVYELGLQNGERPYFAMKLVKGETLAVQLARRSDPADGRSRLIGVFEQVCQTLAYAHARRVVHRDLKPANVMIGAFGEVQVVDWGFAKVLARGEEDEERAALARKMDKARSVIETVRSGSGSGSGSASVAGSMLGTPAYMSPEQAQGDVEHLDERADVFGLGAILCEILTGAPPYRKQDGDVVRQAAGAMLDPARARLAECGADEALVALCLECLAPARAARPASAQELAERVAAYLGSVEERVRQAQVSAAQARTKQRATLAAAVAGFVVLVVGAGVWIRLDGQAQERSRSALARLATAMSEASGARGQAAEGQDMNLWATALVKAKQAEVLCQDEAVDAKARFEADALVVAVQREQDAAAAEARRRVRDDTMIQRLEDLRIPTDEHLRGEGILREHRRLDAAYTDAFTGYLEGALLFEDAIGTVLASMQTGDIATVLATSLDHWSLIRTGLGGEPSAPEASRTARIRVLAEQLDAEDEWRMELRSLLPDAAANGVRLLALAEQADFATLTAAGCRVLGEALWRAGEEGEATRVLRRAQQLHPQDFDLCFALALNLERLPEARLAPARSSAPVAVVSKFMLERGRPRLGRRWEEAVTTYRIAHALRPAQNEVLHRQGMALDRLGRHSEAEQLFRILLERDPDTAHWHYHVAGSLQDQGSVGDALESYQRAIELDPGDYKSHQNSGLLLFDQGDPEEAAESFRSAVAIDPRHEGANVGLGNALKRQGKVKEAVDSHREWLLIDPGSAAAHWCLGLALSLQDKPEQAIASFESALELDPRHALARFSLGEVFQQQGRLMDAIASFREALTIWSPRGDAFSVKWTGRAETREFHARVLLGYNQKRYQEVVALAEATLVRASEPVGGIRDLEEIAARGVMAAACYNSACTAAVLAAGVETELSAAERIRVRGLSRTWLLRAVVEWRARLGSAATADSARRSLTHALGDTDFATVRGAALESLPETEREAWQEVWVAVGDALKAGGR